MNNSPLDANDCPGCDAGWVMAELLCPRCDSRVQRHCPDLVSDWLEARVDAFGGKAGKLEMLPARAAFDLIASEAFYRGVLVGTARVLHTRSEGVVTRQPQKGARP